MKFNSFRLWTSLTLLLAAAAFSACSYHEDKDRTGNRSQVDTTVRHNSDGSTERTTEIHR